MHSKLPVLLAFVLAMFGSQSQAVPTIQHWQLANGAAVYFVPTEGLPLLDVQLVFDAGSARDGEKLGLAALTSALIDQGAGGLTAQQIAEQLDSVGARMGASSSRDYTSISFRSLSDQQTLKTAWGVLTKVINTPRFPTLDFSREKQRTLLSIKQREESPGTLAQLALYRHMYGEHPYANPIQGQYDSVNKLSVNELKAFYKKYYVGSNLTMVLVGGISRQQAELLVDQAVGQLASGEKAAPIAAVDTPLNGAVIQQSYPSQQTHVLYGLPVLKHNDEDYFALYVGNHILGGSGFSSRIVKEIREERGLAYSAYSYFSPMLQKGPFMMGLQTKNESLDEAVKATKQVLGQFVDKGPSEEELIAAKKNISGGFALKLDSNKKLLANVVGIVVSGAPLDYLNTYVQKINAVTAKQIQQAFQRRVRIKSMTLVTVGENKDTNN